MVIDKKEFKPNDIVKSCEYLEKGCCVQIGGIYCCVHGSKASPAIVTTDEIVNGDVSYDKIVQRKRELFEALNGLRPDYNLEGCADCCNIVEKEYKNVHFDKIGGSPMAGGFNIQHYTECNERCLYCCYAQTNDFYKPKYDMLKIFEMFREKGKLGKNNWIDFSGGEPAMLKNLEEILTYMMDNEMGTIDLYSNASIYSPIIEKGLRENKIILTTSLDTGLKSTYAHLRGADLYTKVIENLIKYRNTGTNGLWLKYVITEHNRTEDDLWSFMTAIMAIRPNKVMICPDFPYGDKEIPDETVLFAAKLWHLVQKFMGLVPVDYTSAMGDPKFVKYREEMYKEVERLNKKDPLCDCYVLKPYIPPKETEQNAKLPFVQKVFSVRNEGNHKVIRVAGAKLKIKRKVKNA